MKRILFVMVSVLVLCLLVQPAGIQAQGKGKAKTMTASGTVKSVSGNSLVISAAGGKDMTLTVDNDTKIIGKGLSTKKMEKGKKLTAPEAVAMGDQVSVTYHDMGGTMHAAEVRVM